jgi:hypothetical protein
MTFCGHSVGRHYILSSHGTLPDVIHCIALYFKDLFSTLSYDCMVNCVLLMISGH